MVKFCFIGDLHFEALDKYYDKVANPNRFIFEQLDKAITYCRKVGIKNIFQLGDVFDHPYPDQKSIKEFLEFLHKNNDLNFYIIAGNHDYSNIKTTSLEVGSFLSDTNLLSNVKIYTKAHHEVIEGVNVFFAPYPAYKKFEYLKGTPCLCLGHFEVKGAKHDSGQIIKSGVGSEELEQEDSWILGHLHRQQTINSKLYYTGTMLQYNFGEPLPKGFTVSNIIEKEDKSIGLEHNYVKLDTPYILENININRQEDFEQLQLNNSKYYYKLFIDNPSIIVPQKLINGSVNNIYKIIHCREGKLNQIEGEALSLSETFNLDDDKERLFEPLGGLEAHLEAENFTTEEVTYTMQRVGSLSLDFNPKRS